MDDLKQHSKKLGFKNQGFWISGERDNPRAKRNEELRGEKVFSKRVVTNGPMDAEHKTRRALEVIVRLYREGKITKETAREVAMDL